VHAELPEGQRIKASLFITKFREELQAKYYALTAQDKESLIEGLKLSKGGKKVVERARPKQAAKITSVTMDSITSKVSFL
jgi:hypothetical protein